MKMLYFAGVLPLVLGACATTPTTLPDVSSLAVIAQPTVPDRQTRHQAVIRDFERREPTNPKSWRQLNDDQTTSGGHSS